MHSIISKNLFRFIFIILIIFSFSPFFLTNLVKAHPQPLFVNEFTFRYRPDFIVLDYKIRIEPVIKEDIFHQIDIDGDLTIDEKDLKEYANTVLFPNLTSRLNNQDLKYEIIGTKGLEKSDIKSLDDYAEINFRAINPILKPANSIYVKYNHKYLKNDAYGDYNAYMDDIFEVPGIQRTNIETTNPNGLEDYSTDFIFTDKKPAMQSTIAAAPVNISKNNIFQDFQKLSTDLTNQVKNYNFENPYIFVTAFLLLFIAGALHALTPGHGKSMVAAFLLGKKNSKMLDILILGISITLAHTLVIYIIGFVLLSIRETANAQNIVLFIEKVSAWLFLGLGLILLFNAWRAYEEYSHHNKSLRGHHHTQKKQTDHENNHHIHDHGHPHAWENGNLNIKSRWDLFYAGISGGIVPCFDALSILFVFNSIGRVDLGLILVFVFSLGLSAAIILLGISLLYGKEKLKLEDKIGPRAEYILPFTSGAIVALFGIFYILTK